MSPNAFGAASMIVDVQGGGCHVVVDCQHGSTLITARRVHGAPDNRQVIARAVVRHYLGEGCACTVELRQRYLTTEQRAAVETRRSIVDQAEARN